MARYVILIRNPTTGSISFVGDTETAVLETFPTEKEAEEAACTTPLCQAWPYSVVEAP